MFHLVAAMEEEARTLNAQAGPEVQAHGPFVVVALDAKLSQERGYLALLPDPPGWSRGLSGAASSVGAVVEVC